MTDIIERLRYFGTSGACENLSYMASCACREAANEIERLRTENEKLRTIMEEEGGMYVDFYLSMGQEGR